MFTVLLTSQTIFARQSESKVIYFGTSAESVEVPFGEPTVFKFNKRVKRFSQSSTYTIKPEDEVDPDYTTLVVIPKFTTGSERVSFVLENNHVARIHLKTIKNKGESFKEMSYEFRRKSHLDPKKAPLIGEVELLKAMVKDQNVAGFKRKKVNKRVSSGKKGVTSRLIRTYEGRHMNGYVFKLTNELKRNKVKVDVRKFSIGNPNLAILSQADSAVL